MYHLFLSVMQNNHHAIPKIFQQVQSGHSVLMLGIVSDNNLKHRSLLNIKKWVYKINYTTESMMKTYVEAPISRREI